jgi:tetratricopeptide (TPR) repeat protein|tara:strand:- start:804 stop:1649 length:846 start_codon:yes stop_codon:yes gene_type:complete
MKKLILIISILILGCDTTTSTQNNQWTFDSTDGSYIQWNGENTNANEMLHHAMKHLYNVENEKSMTFFEKVLEYDSTLFGPHVVLAGFSVEGSEKQKMHIEKAKALVEDNNETSKVFVSMLDLPRGGNWPLVTEGAHDLWSKMRELEPKGKLIHYYYAFTNPDPDQRIKEMELLLSEIRDQKGDSNSLPTSGDHSYMVPPIINSLGYFYYGIGEKEKAKTHFDEYLSLYKGYNAYDSMGEFYYNEGDMENALKYYNKAIEMYPPATSATSMIAKINGLNKS